MIEERSDVAHVAIVLSGKISFHFTRDGESIPTAIYRKRPDILHHAGFHLGMPNPFEFRADEDGTRLVLIDEATVFELTTQDVAFTKYLLTDLSYRVVVALNFLREQREEPLQLRLAKRLRDIAKEDDTVEYTQAEIAEFLAVTRISISKGLKTLEELQLIERRERALIAIKRDALSAWIDEEQKLVVNRFALRGD